MERTGQYIRICCSWAFLERDLRYFLVIFSYSYSPLRHRRKVTTVAKRSRIKIVTFPAFKQWKWQLEFRIRNHNLEAPYTLIVYVAWQEISLLFGYRWLRVHFDFSRTFKVVDFCTIWRAIYDFLLVINYDLGSILHCLWDIAPRRKFKTTLI